MDLNKQRLIKQCQISLGEEFDQDFLYFEEADFTSIKSIQNTYELFEKNLDGRTRAFKEKIKKLSYAKGSLGEDEEVEESTAAYAKSLEKIAKDRQMKMLSKKDRENLISIAKLLDREKKEEVDEDLEESTELFQKGKITFTKFSMGKNKGSGLQINYGRQYIQVPEKDIKQLYTALVYVTKSVPQFKI